MTDLVNSNNNYESELNDLLIQRLQKLYKVKSGDIAYRIFLIRFLLENITTYKHSVKERFELEAKLPYFLIEELNIPLFDNKIVYKGANIVIYHSSGNSLSNILDDWAFRYGNTLTSNLRGEKIFRIDLVKEELNNIIKKAESLIKISKREDTYHNYFMYSSLKILDTSYGISPVNTERIENISYPKYYNDFKITLEEKYEMLVHADKMQHGTLNVLSEESLENYLIYNLDSIEKGLKLLKSQYVIDNGRIDILAVDMKKNYCIIELKVENDERLIWQSIYYPMAIKNKLKTDKIRMMVIAPKFPEYILMPLKQLTNVEIFKFKAKMEYNKIKDLNIKKIA